MHDAPISLLLAVGNNLILRVKLPDHINKSVPSSWVRLASVMRRHRWCLRVEHQRGSASQRAMFTGARWLLIGFRHISSLKIEKLSCRGQWWKCEKLPMLWRVATQEGSTWSRRTGAKSGAFLACDRDFVNFRSQEFDSASCKTGVNIS